MVNMKDSEAFNQATEVLVQEFLSTLTSTQRLRGLRPEERVHGLRPEDLLQGLSVVQGQTPEQHE